MSQNTPGKQVQFEEMMQELRNEYLEGLPCKIDEIKKVFHEKNMSTLKEDFHKLKGTGKTYGFPEISELGELVERLLTLKPQIFSQIIPPAISLLQDIYQIRRDSRCLDLQNDPRFQAIRILNP